jgi:hypothetical protein
MALVLHITKDNIEPVEGTHRENPRTEASREIDYSRKKRIYVKRKAHAYKQIQLMQGVKDPKKYERKKTSGGPKSELVEIKTKVGDKEFISKIRLPKKRTKKVV